MLKQMMKASAYCIQIENQVSDEKQCGHKTEKLLCLMLTSWQK